MNILITGEINEIEYNKVFTYLNSVLYEYLRKPTIIINEDDYYTDRALRLYAKTNNYPFRLYNNYQLAYNFSYIDSIIAVLHGDTVKRSKFFRQVIEYNRVYNKKYIYQYTGIVDTELIYKPLNDKLNSVSKPHIKKLLRDSRNSCKNY